MSDAEASQARKGDAGRTAGRVQAYRAVREQIERDILPIATSVDGSSFTFQASLHDLDLRRGGYVVLQDARCRRLGQVTDIRAETELVSGDDSTGASSRMTVRLAKGSGTVLDTDGRPFHDTSVRPADPEEVRDWVRRTQSRRAGLTVGELLLAPGVPATLDSGGLGRHTFMCGQSGSGKTYSLGVLLEQVLMETTLRVVILDPNSDYVGLPHVRQGADRELARRYAPVTSDVAVWTNDPHGTHPLRLRFADLDPAVQGAALGLDPIRDRDEYAMLAELLRLQTNGEPLVTSLDQLLASEIPGARQLGLRAGNLGILEWQLWSPYERSLVTELRAPSSRCTVVDLGSLDTEQEQRVVATAVLSTLWARRATREPCLIVVDEAHNICPAEPVDAVNRLSAQRSVQIAAEGRKYGLYLLTSTQRPHKVHENVVSQCDNLLLMRMNSDADLAELATLLSFVPPGLMAGATSFQMGQALVAGRLMPQPAYIRMGERASEEGGADVPDTWAARR